jgi:DNA-binding transcriptional LysR family regulator
MDSGVELRHLRYFAALAGERHFGRAAAVLHVTQPVLSRQMRQLERLLGFPVIARTRPTVDLTPAGVVFYEEAQRTLQQAERALRVARAAVGVPTPFSVTFEPCSSFHGFDRVVRRVAATQPDLQFEIDETPVGEHPHRLRTGAVDLAYGHRDEGAPGIEFIPLSDEPLLVVLPADHGLARSRSISLAALADDPFVFWVRALAPACHDTILQLLRANGVTADVRHRASDHRRNLELVAAGLGWTVAPACARHAHQAGVVLRPIAGSATTIQVGLSRLAANRDPRVAAVVTEWRAVAAAASGDARDRRNGHSRQLLTGTSSSR